MSKSKTILLTLISSLIIILFFVLAGEKQTEIQTSKIVNPPTAFNTIENTNSEPISNPITEKAYLEIDNLKYEGEILGEDHVYDFMKRLKEEDKISFTEKNYLGIGKFIEEINGIHNDGKNFWIYYVNGIKAEVGVSTMTIKPGDIISWKFEQDINN